MKRIVLFFVPFLFAGLHLSAQWTVNTVPNPMSQNKTFVSNPDKILSAEQANLLDSIVKGIERQTSAEIAIVMLQSIGNEVPKTFATSLFNLWGVGKKESDNGLLVLFVMDQRRLEFEAGYGMEIALTDAMCYQIQQDNMVPRFKEGDYGKGMIDGMLAVATVLTNMQFEISETGNSISTSSLSKEYSTTNSNSSSSTSDDYYNYNNDYNNDYSYDYYADYESPLGIYFRIVLFAMLLYLLLYIITIFQKDYFKRYQTLRIFKLYIWFILFPIPFVLIYIYTKRLLENWRNTPRISPKTGKRMRKLNEEQDDKYLKSG
ncbi:MAG: TPM domain-containing protein, partial [Bacteroidales bacterium]|nr:TPM domain-containing protein [Bacteroidales bacterium]